MYPCQHQRGSFSQRCCLATPTWHSLATSYIALRLARPSSLCSSALITSTWVKQQLQWLAPRKRPLLALGIHVNDKKSGQRATGIDLGNLANWKYFCGGVDVMINSEQRRMEQCCQPESLKQHHIQIPSKPLHGGPSKIQMRLF
jgi:hypothetical protein